jgi:hypothetical protein
MANISILYIIILLPELHYNVAKLITPSFGLPLDMSNLISCDFQVCVVVLFISSYADGKSNILEQPPQKWAVDPDISHFSIIHKRACY